MSTPGNLPIGNGAASPFDVALLAQMANRFFGAPPNADPLSFTPPNSGALPHGGASAGSTTTATEQLPHHLVREVPLGVTPPVNPELPSEAELRVLLASFAEPTHSAPVSSSTPQFGSLPPELTADVPLAPTSSIAVGLPGEAELGLLLSAMAPAALPESGKIPSAQPLFYFLDYGQTPQLEPPRAHEQIAGVATPFDVNRIRRDFPILNERVNGRPLVWLDNAATTQKPQAVIDRIKHFYEHENSNIHRAAHELAARATDAYESARDKVRGFLNASSPNEIVFVRGATEGINLVAKSWGRQHIDAGDEIVVTWLEHHANIVPWQQLAAETGAKLRPAPVDDSGQVLLDELGKLLTSKTKLVAFTHVSNALGTITPARQIVEMAHHVGAKVLIDGAQAVSHMPVDVQHLGADWYIFSGHKVFGPTGIGAVYGKEALLNATQPWQGGGNMITDVTFERALYQQAPGRFEAGTGNIADAVGLGAAIDYVTALGMDRIVEYEHQLLLYATKHLQDIPGLRLIGTAADKASVLSFVLDGYRTEDVGAELNREGIAVRSGHHCAQPILRRFGVEATVRPSLAFYNTCADIDALVTTLRRLSTARPPI